jgi:hypothetical protein
VRLHPHAAGLVAILDPDWRRKIWLGGLWLLIPVVGWPALVFSTLLFPVACLSLALAPEQWLTLQETLFGVGAYAVLVSLIPSGFLQVSLTRRYRSAFALWRAIPFVARNLSLYLEAWWHSSLMSLAGHLALPLSPWGVVWCFLGIVAPGTGSGRRQVAEAAGLPVSVLDLHAFSVPLPRLFDRTEKT